MPRPHPLALALAAAAAAALAAALAFARRSRRLRAASLAFTEAHELCALLRTGQLRSLELLDLLLARAARLDPRLNALVVRDFRRARERAAAADAALAEGRLLGVLHGLPVTIKEELAVAGLACTQGRPECARERTRASCEAVARLEAAGAIVFAKTNVPLGCLDWQAYNPLYGATANPWDARRTPGGSSGGSAAAVAAGLSPLDVGGDVAGSIRLPASFCGVVGLAPSHERVPCRGAHSMVVYGPIARSAADCALALAVLEAPAPLPQQRRMTLAGATAAARLALSAVVGGVEWRSVRVARWQEHAGAPKVDADVAFALEEVARRLRAAGALVDDAARPALTDEQLCAAGPGPGVGCAVAYQALLAHCDGAVRPAEELLEAQEEIKLAWDQFFEQGYDAVVAPVTVSAAFVSDLQPPPANAFTPLDRTMKLDSGEERPYGDHYFWPHLAIVAGLPAISVPTGKTRGTKLPIGVQLIGPRGSDVRLLQLSHALMALCQTATAEVPPGFGA